MCVNDVRSERPVRGGHTGERPQVLVRPDLTAHLDIDMGHLQSAIGLLGRAAHSNLVAPLGRFPSEDADVPERAADAGPDDVQDPSHSAEC